MSHNCFCFVFTGYQKWECKMFEIWFPSGFLHCLGNVLIMIAKSVKNVWTCLKMQTSVHKCKYLSTLSGIEKCLNILRVFVCYRFNVMTQSSLKQCTHIFKNIEQHVIIFYINGLQRYNFFQFFFFFIEL